MGSGELISIASISTARSAPNLEFYTALPSRATCRAPTKILRERRGEEEDGGGVNF